MKVAAAAAVAVVVAVVVVVVVCVVERVAAVDVAHWIIRPLAANN